MAGRRAYRVNCRTSDFYCRIRTSSFPPAVLWWRIGDTGETQICPSAGRLSGYVHLFDLPSQDGATAFGQIPHPQHAAHRVSSLIDSKRDGHRCSRGQRAAASTVVMTWIAPSTAQLLCRLAETDQRDLRWVDHPEDRVNPWSPTLSWWSRSDSLSPKFLVPRAPDLISGFRISLDDSDEFLH